MVKRKQFPSHWKIAIILRKTTSRVRPREVIFQTRPLSPAVPLPPCRSSPSFRSSLLDLYLGETLHKGSYTKKWARNTINFGGHHKWSVYYLKHLRRKLNWVISPPTLLNTRVATLVKERFIGSECEPKHVENRLKTIKGLWNTITRLRNKSGFGWDDNMKMITCSKETFDEEIMAHHTHEKFLNKKIEMYDEMSIVVGKDMATGAYAKSFNDIDVEVSIENSFAQDIECNEFEEVTKPKEASTATSSKPRSHRKRPREDRDSSFDLLAGQVGEVASAIKKLSDDNVNTEDLYKEVMKVEGFDEEFLGSVFDHLNANTNLAKGFMVKSENLRRKWIEKFMTNEWQY